MDTSRLRGARLRAVSRGMIRSRVYGRGLGHRHKFRVASASMVFKAMNLSQGVSVGKEEKGSWSPLPLRGC